MVTTLLVLIAVNLIGYLVVYLLLREKVRRASSAQAAVSEVREEVNRLIVELNQTADRNVALLEDRIAGLAELLSKADKKMGLLRRESEKHDMGAQVYGRIIDSRPEAPSRPGAPARPEAKARTAPEAPGEPDFMGAGMTKAMVRFESLPDMNTGVVMAIFCLASFPPVMKRNRRMKLPSSELPLVAIGVSTTASDG